MKQLKDPFEAAFKEQQDSPTRLLKDESFDIHTQNPDLHRPIASAAALTSDRSYQFEEEEDYDAVEEDNYNSGSGKVDHHGINLSQTIPPSSTLLVSTAPTTSSAKIKFNEDEEEEENMDVELAKFPSSGDPSKMAKMQAILSQLTEEQMSRYESFRRAGFQKSSMKRLLVSITGTQKISVPMTIVVSGIAKLFVGELVETARMVMTERKESGPIRPCHLREAYRRLKLEGKVFKRSVPRLFR